MMRHNSLPALCSVVVTPERFRPVCRPDSIPVVIRVMVMSAFLVASIGIVQQYLDWNYLLQGAAPGSTFSNRNLAGHVIVICLPLAFFGLLLHGSSVTNKVLSSTAIIVIGIYAYHIKSTGVWVSIAVEIILLPGSVGGDYRVVLLPQSAWVPCLRNTFNIL